MPLVKTRGIVIRETGLGEADKIITLLTDNLGKVQAVAHGSRKSKSKLLSSTQIFGYCEYVLYKGKSLYTISQAEVKESFQGLLYDLYTLTYSSYIVELVDTLTQDSESNIELFMLLLKTLYLMTDTNIDRELLTRVFELKSMSLSGFMPNFSECMICRNKDVSGLRFSSRLGGIICGRCSENDKQSISMDISTGNIMRYLIGVEIEKVRNIKVSKENRNEMKKIMKNYIKYYLEKDFKSLEFLDDIRHVDNIL